MSDELDRSQAFQEETHNQDNQSEHSEESVGSRMGNPNTFAFRIIPNAQTKEDSN